MITDDAGALNPNEFVSSTTPIYSIDTAKVRYSLSPRDAGNSRERIKIHVKSTQNSCEIRASFSQLPCIGKIRAGNFHT